MWPVCVSVVLKNNRLLKYTNFQHNFNTKMGYVTADLRLAAPGSTLNA